MAYISEPILQKCPSLFALSPGDSKVSLLVVFPPASANPQLISRERQAAGPATVGHANEPSASSRMGKKLLYQRRESKRERKKEREGGFAECRCGQCACMREEREKREREEVINLSKRRNPGILPSLEDLLFYTVAEGQETIPAHKFLTALKTTGLRTGDPRLKECMETLKETLKETADGVTLDRHLFKKCVQSNIVLLTQAFRKKFVIPDFHSFSTHIDELYDSAGKLTGGQVADYIPQLAKFSPDLWGVSLCTVDGQRHTVGDTKVPFCLQSCVKPLKYAVAVHDHGTEYVHSFIGKEPSGLRFNKLFLNEEDKPHNPMVNAGAIVCTSLIKQGAGTAEKFDYVMNFLKQMAGNEYVGFSNATFQSERESGDRNFAIGYYLKEKKCFPEGTDMTSVLDFYFQLCSIEVTCESASVMAATLANGGICPITGERVGLPAKSGVAGGILLVVPNVMGVMCWSPPLDKLGNSVRGIQFCTDLVELFNFHNYDNLRHFAKKYDPRREGGDQRVCLVCDGHGAERYDSRTALHVAAAEGHVEVVRFLLEACKVNPVPRDRWGNTPLDEAIHFGHKSVVELLQQFQDEQCTPLVAVTRTARRRAWTASTNAYFTFTITQRK
ncbi:hypothetical protein WMY93_002140 [Mugilogobius chulae]|uniref:glutaminase n=1 Tax=Mugilogobius chulae TaxID=88201 RepID=A0AAW0PVM1_9GOBI